MADWRARSQIVAVVLAGEAVHRILTQIAFGRGLRHGRRLYVELAQERIWLVIYNPWLSLYLLGYAGVNIALFLCVMQRVKALRRRGVQA